MPPVNVTIVEIFDPPSSSISTMVRGHRYSLVIQTDSGAGSTSADVRESNLHQLLATISVSKVSSFSTIKMSEALARMFIALANKQFPIVN